MINVTDRVPQSPNRWKLTKAGGEAEYVTLERADNPAKTGTPINRTVFLDLQGFAPKRTVLNADGSITETDTASGTIKTTRLVGGNVVETFSGSGGQTVTKTTSMSGNTIIEVLS